jgi:hypothetical protein
MSEKKGIAAGDRIVGCLCFEKPGPQNTRRTLEWAAQRAGELGISHVVVASASGETGLLAAEIFPAAHVVVVTHSTGFMKPNFQELGPENRTKLERAGVRILTCQHAFGGVGRSVRKKLGTYELDEIIAYALRRFGEGAKVAVEVTLMAADAGLIPAGKPCVAVGGTNRGADTALVLVAANAQDFLDLKVQEILAKPYLAD